VSVGLGFKGEGCGSRVGDGHRVNGGGIFMKKAKTFGPK